jgi:energy-coupling factor transporter ATP-binding protein EcfA2
MGKDDDKNLQKKRCVILYGKPGSGKSKIVKYMAQIFDSHVKNEAKGIYDEKISRKGAHKQLLIFNEANMYRLFSKSSGLPAMKKLMEGDGISLEVKFGHPCTGFIGANIIITCNNLCFPFIEPVASTSGYTKQEFQIENEAM